MSLVDHIGFSVRDYPRSRDFYRAVLARLGHHLLMEVSAEQTGTANHAGFGRDGKPEFWIGDGASPLQGRLHVCFKAGKRSEVDAFHTQALALGATDNGAPGIRAHYHPNYYAAFVLDLDGHNIEAVCHTPE